MPYFNESFHNATSPIHYSVNNGSGGFADSFEVLDSARLLGFRTKPNAKALSFSEVPDITADPYAYFLDSTSRNRYHDRLRERGLKPEGSPDRGHTLDLVTHASTGKRLNLVDTYTYPGQPTSVSVYNGAQVYISPSAGDRLNDVHPGTTTEPTPYQESGFGNFAQAAYARSAPTSVQFDAAQFLGELREGLPRLIPSLLQGKAGLFRNLGSDYLNVEFGWKPFISDLQNAAKALFAATNAFSHMGKRVHRSYRLPPIEVMDVRSFQRGSNIMVSNSQGVAPLPGYAQATVTSGLFLNLDVTYTKRRYVQRWFEGEFTSFMPLRFDPTDDFQRYNALVNLKVTPETLWELTPWSWLIDWGLRIGDTIASNQLASNDLLVMHYGYAMEHSVYQTGFSGRVLSIASQDGHTWTGRPAVGSYVAQNTVTSYKKRMRANPYGFQAGSFESLTGNQAAILGALGLTKLK